MNITQKTGTTLQFQGNPVWWAILVLAFMSGVFLYNASSKNLVLNKNSQNQATLEVVNRWLGFYETKRRLIPNVRDIEIRRHNSKHQMVAMTSNSAVPIDKGFSSRIEDSKCFQFVEESKALLRSSQKGRVSARVSYFLLGIFDGLLLIASLAFCCKIQGLLDSEKNLLIIQKRHIFGVRKRKIPFSQIQSFAIELTQGDRKIYGNFKTNNSSDDKSLDSYCVSAVLQNREAISLSPSFSEPIVNWYRLVSILNQFLIQFQDRQKSLKPCALCGNNTAEKECFQDDANRYYHSFHYERYGFVS